MSVCETVCCAVSFFFSEEEDCEERIRKKRERDGKRGRKKRMRERERERSLLPGSLARLSIRDAVFGGATVTRVGHKEELQRASGRKKKRKEASTS